jgi:hypothetical protein
MTKEIELDLGDAEITALSSVYIDRGIKQESWKIQKARVSGRVLTATVNMTETFVSPTDPAGFHLSIFCTQEIISQLANIYLHVAAGLTSKSRESWMRECKFNYRNVIRTTENIQVEMNFVSQKWIGDTLAALAQCRMYDDNGGLFTARLKGMLR